MKTKILLSALTVGFMVSAICQKPTMVLTFTADNFGQHVALNSILIENLSQGGDTTLYAPDTVLQANYITRIGNNQPSEEDIFFVSQNYPNPMAGKTTVNIYLPGNENAHITVSDLMGRELICVEYLLCHGSHSFTFFPGREILYFLTTKIDQQSQTIKMFNSPSNASVSAICKLEFNSQQTGFNEFKSGNNLSNFVFDLGDQLQYTASSALGDRTIIDTPSGNQTYTFQFGSGGIPCPGMPTVTDIDGNAYNTVHIGIQCWMAENLKTTTYHNGTSIPNVTDTFAWQMLSTGAYVWYNNDISWKPLYGALYNYYTTVDANGLCPEGWHVPTDDEWTYLTDFIGGTGDPHGNEIKSCRQVNSPLGGSCNTSLHPRWAENTYNANYGTDDYGFSGLPGGGRMDSGNFDYLGTSSKWWSSTEDNWLCTWSHCLSYYYGNISCYYENKTHGLSVRCLRDY